MNPADYEKRTIELLHYGDFDNLAKSLVTPMDEKQSVCKIINGDCLKVLRDMKEHSVHLVITDPPYFLDSLDDKWNDDSINKKINKSGVIGGLPVGMKFDSQQGMRLQGFMNKVSRELMRILVPGGFFVSFSQPRLVHRLTVGMEEADFEIRDMFAWHYTQRAQAKAFSQNHFIEKMELSDKEKAELKKKLGGRKTPQLRPQFESLVLAQKPRIGTFVENWKVWETGLVDMKQTLDGKVPSTVMSVEKERSGKTIGHMTPKPIKLLSHLVRLFSVQGQVVLDPFLGSGSTAIAALQNNRSCIGIEIEEEYTKLSKKRIEEAMNA